MTGVQPGRDGEVCNDWCGPGSHHMPSCPAAPSEPPAEARQDDPVCICPGPTWCPRHGRDVPFAARPSADTETLRDVLLKHHPIANTDTGPLKGCRCGQVRLGEDIIAHVAAEVLATLDGDQ